MKTRYFIISIIIFLLIITGFRLLWMKQFTQSADENVLQGEVDLRDINILEKGILLLDGEWEFYPNQLIIDEGKSTKGETNYAKVPDGWNEHFSEKKFAAHGFGSYRLKLLVDPAIESNFSIFFPSIRSASEIYINGKKLSQSGEIGKQPEQTVARNVPQYITFPADEDGHIEVVVQVANFQDIRRSGIIRSVKFGSEIAMTHERNLSISIQAVAAGFFILHAIYAIILFVLGNRKREMLSFSVVLFALAFVIVASTDEKIVHLLINIPYKWDFRLANGLGLLAGFALLHSFDHSKLPYWRQINPLITIIFLGTIITIFLSTPMQIVRLLPALSVVGFVLILFTIISVIRRIYENLYGNILLLFALLAAMHSFVWTLYWREIGISVIHYPFDLIIAIICFSAVWFKDYFDVHAETKNLAIELEQANKNKDRFLAQTSHEFKNPLHGIINLSQAVLHREKSLQQESTHELNMIRSVGRRLSILLNDLLDDASLKGGQPRLNKRTFELQPVISGVIDLLEIYIDNKRVKIFNHIPDNFPPIYGDENRVTQIVYNLLHNAIKFTNEGKIIISAHMKNSEEAIIQVKDTGTGIDEQTLEEIFLPFEQIGQDTTVNQGYGLGLNISKQLIELHGGDLHVQSTVNEGSTFTFTLSLASKKQQAEYMTPLAESIVNPPSETENHYILSENTLPMNEVPLQSSGEKYSLIRANNQYFNLLVVDDDPINLNVMKSILSGELFSVTTANSGKSALEMLNSKTWDLVISDVMMPKMSGLELTEKIRERYTFTDLPILLLTARSEPQDIKAGFLAGANDYVTKPVEYLELTSRVNALIAIKSAVQEQLRLKSAWLQAQIQPHFLFNTLNSIISLSTIDIDKMNHLLIELSDYLRSKFQFNDIESLIPIQDELSIVKSYLNIEKVRFGDRLKVNWEIDETVQVKIPFLSIQPLVENAIHHGIMQRVSGGEITIRVVHEQSQTIITVLDNGVGISQEKLAKLLDQDENNGASIGLINTNQRLMQHFGTGLNIKSTIDEGTSVSFTI